MPKYLQTMSKYNDTLGKYFQFITKKSISFYLQKVTEVRKINHTTQILQKW